MLLDFLVPFGGDSHHERATCLAFLNVGNHLVVRRALGGHHDHREPGVDQRDRAVLHLARCVGLGVEVADLFELERALVADG